MEFRPEVIGFAREVGRELPSSSSMATWLLYVPELPVETHRRLPVLDSKAIAKGALVTALSVGVMQPNAAYASETTSLPGAPIEGSNRVESSNIPSAEISFSKLDIQLVSSQTDLKEADEDKNRTESRGKKSKQPEPAYAPPRPSEPSTNSPSESVSPANGTVEKNRNNKKVNTGDNKQSEPPRQQELPKSDPKSEQTTPPPAEKNTDQEKKNDKTVFSRLSEVVVDKLPKWDVFEDKKSKEERQENQRTRERPYTPPAEELVVDDPVQEIPNTSEPTEKPQESVNGSIELPELAPYVPPVVKKKDNKPEKTPDVKVIPELPKEIEEPSPDGIDPEPEAPSRSGFRGKFKDTIDSIVGETEFSLEDIMEFGTQAEEVLPPPPVPEKTPSSGVEKLPRKDDIINDQKTRYGRSGELQPHELEYIDGERFGKNRLHPVMAKAFRELNEAAEAEIGVTLDITSEFDSYRDYATQVVTKRNKGSQAAVAGTSNHGWGLAVDLVGMGGIGNDTEKYKWLKANSDRFGIEHPKWAWPAAECKAAGLPVKRRVCGSNPEKWHWELAEDGTLNYVPDPKAPPAPPAPEPVPIEAPVVVPTFMTASELVGSTVIDLQELAYEEIETATLYPSFALATVIPTPQPEIESGISIESLTDEEFAAMLMPDEQAQQAPVAPPESLNPETPPASAEAPEGKLPRPSLDFNVSTPSGVTAEELERVFAGTGFAGLGQAFVEVEREYGINAILWASHAYQEVGADGRSNIGEKKNNIFGYGAFDRDPFNSAMHFNSKAEGVKFVAEKFRTNYVSPDGKFHTGDQIGNVFKRYATDQKKGKKVADIMTSLTDRINNHR